MMNRADKEKVVSSLKADIDKASAIFLTNLIGVSANDSAKVRRSVREAQGKVVITRNTLFKRASVGTPTEKFFENLKGPTAVAFAFEDAVGVAKVLQEASKELEIIALRGGMLNGEPLSVAQVLELASLPSRQEMLATLLATFNAPVSAFVRVLNSIKEKKEEEAPVAAAPKAEGVKAETKEEATTTVEAAPVDTTKEPETKE